MSADGGFDGLVEVVGTVGHEDVGTGRVLVGIDAVDGVEHVEETIGIAGLDDVPVALALIVGLAGVGDLHAVEVHLSGGAHGEGDGAAGALVVEGNDLTVVLPFADAGEGAYLLAVLGDDDIVGLTVAAEGEGDGGLRTYEQVDAVAVDQGPAVLVVVEIVGSEGVEGLMVGRVEELVGEVVDVLAVGVGCLYLGGDGIEADVAGDDGRRLVFLTAGGLLEPAAHLVALGAGGLVEIVVEVTDGLVLFTDGLQEDGLLVGVDIGEGVVGLLDDGEDVVEVVVAQGHRDGDLTLGGVLLGLGDDGVGGADHRGFLGKFEHSLVGVVEDLLGGVFLTVDGERGEDGHFNLRAVESTLDDDVGEAYLLAVLQVVEVDEQSALALGRRGTCHVVGEFAEGGTLVVAGWLHTLGEQDGGLVGVLPGDVEQSVVGTETGGLQRYLGGCEREAEAGLEDEADGVRLVGSRSALDFVLLIDGHELCLSDAVGIESEELKVAAPGDLTDDEVGGCFAKVGLLSFGAEVEGEGDGGGFVVEDGSLGSILCPTCEGEHQHE